MRKTADGNEPVQAIRRSCPPELGASAAQLVLVRSGAQLLLANLSAIPDNSILTG
jgi:hypothetical protein